MSSYDHCDYGDTCHCNGYYLDERGDQHYCSCSFGDDLRKLDAKGSTIDDWDVECITCGRNAPFYDRAEFDAPPGWYSFTIALCEDGAQVSLLTCSKACTKLGWKQEPRRAKIKPKKSTKIMPHPAATSLL